MTDDAGNTPGTPSNGQTEKDIMPDVNSNKPQGGKEIFPQEKSPAKNMPDANSSKPQGGKEIFPQEKSPAKKMN
jgi:hypothetical protein